MHSIIDLKNIKSRIQTLHDDVLIKKKVSLSILRLDEVDEHVSGNKIFKLYYFLKEALASKHKKILTFGGSYSNHLAATAFICRQQGLRCAGIVRGEKPAILSHTLQFCIEQGMELIFLDRTSYGRATRGEPTINLQELYGDHLTIPEGGFSPEGRRGAELINNCFDENNYSHICCSIGTATTFAGLLNRSMGVAEFQGFPVLKNLVDISERLQKLQVRSISNFIIHDDFHFGGYAKKTPELLKFMNDFYEKNSVPLDFVYTGKMMFGIYELIRKNYYAPGSRILSIHTGGLQGNLSLPPGMLNF
ncbi:MAG: pyridoxal-phosphate dependent enzyme [Ginsengibacter sp.]